jgi:dTMP kinase
MHLGKLITVEGTDGSGKGSLLNRLEKALRDMGHDVLRSREPGASNVGEVLRDLMFKNPGSAPRPDGAIPLSGAQVDCLMLCDHIGHVAQVILPALKQGKWILSDRYADSQFAYCAARDHSDYINEAFWKHYGPMPDITILLVGDVNEMLRRAKTRDDSPDAKEPGKQAAKSWSKVEMQTRIQNAYLHNLSNQPRTVIVEVTGKTKEQVFEDAFERMFIKLAQRPKVTQSTIFEAVQ